MAWMPSKECSCTSTGHCAGFNPNQRNPERRAQLGSPWMPSKEGPYANVVNVVVSNTGATTVPSGWLLSVTPQSGAPYVQIDQSWEEKPTLFRGSLAMFGNLVRLPMRSATTLGVFFPVHDLVRLPCLFSTFFSFGFFSLILLSFPSPFYFLFCCLEISTFHFGWCTAPRQAYQALFPGSMATVGGLFESVASRSADWVPHSVQLNGVYCQLTASTA